MSLVVWMFVCMLPFAQGSGEIDDLCAEEVPEGAGIVFGEEAPEIPVIEWLQAETELKLSDLRGQFVVLEFFRTNCPHCIRATPALNELAEKYAGRARVVAVCRDNLDAVAEYMEKHEAAFAVALAPQKAYNLYNVQGVPLAFLIDPQGRVIWSTGPEGIEPILHKALSGEFPRYLDPEFDEMQAERLSMLETRWERGDRMTLWPQALAVREHYPRYHPMFERAREVMKKCATYLVLQIGEADRQIEAGRLSEARVRLEEIVANNPGSTMADHARRRLAQIAQIEAGVPQPPPRRGTQIGGRS